jgi:hypothetical protein
MSNVLLFMVKPSVNFSFPTPPNEALARLGEIDSDDLVMIGWVHDEPLNMISL